MTVFLLCDVVSHASFAKVNLKILKKLQGKGSDYIQKAEEFRKASGIKAPLSKNKDDYSRLLGLHDGITHTNIPSSLGKKIRGDRKNKYTLFTFKY